MSLAKQAEPRNTPRIDACPIAPQLAPMLAPNYDSSMPCFARDGVVALTESLGVFGITDYTVKREMLAGKLNAYKVSNKVRFSEDDVRAWLLGMTR